MRAQINDRDFEQLSAYMDGQLAPAEQRKLEERLRARPDLQEALDDLRRTRALLRSAPRRRAPRNFTLTPEMVGEQAGRRRKAGFFSGLNLFPTLSFASAVATILLVATLLLDLAPGLSPSTAAVPEAPAADVGRTMTKEGDAAGSAPQMEAAPAAPSIMSENPAEAASDLNSGPVIVWGGSYGKGEGGGVAPGCLDGRCGGGAPEFAWGRGGGGGGDGNMAGLGGGGAGPWGMDGSGQISVPPESVQAMQQDNYAAPEAVQPDPSITGTGPILGVAPAEQSGQIIEREAINQGLPVEQPAPVVEEQPAPATVGDGEERILGVPLRLAQIVLAVLAVLTGLAAFLLRRR